MNSSRIIKLSHVHKEHALPVEKANNFMDMITTLHNAHDYQSRNLVVSCAVKRDLIPLPDIAYVNSDGNYSVIHLTTEKTITTSKTLKHWETKINSDNFIRVHNSYLVNKNFIRSINLKDYQLTLSTGITIPFSRSRKAALLSSYSR